MAKNVTKLEKNKKKRGYSKTGTFYPIPSGRGQLVSFATPLRDGFDELFYSITPCRAKKKLLPGERINRVVVTLDVPDIITKKKVKKISFRKICRRFAPHSYVNMDSLKENRLIPDNTTYLKVVGKGKLNKPLMVEAHEFTDRAVRMITLTGGRAIRLI